jgi:predicted dinucleotide-binding enzyme
MTIAILGTGNMAKGLAKQFAAAGEAVVLGSRDAGTAAAVAQALGAGVSGSDVGSAAAAADLVVLAVPYAAAGETIAAAGGLAGKTVLDISNPVTPDYAGLALGHTTSAAEEIQRLAPGARVVKGFNTVFAEVLQSGGEVDGRPVTVFLAGDDAAAVEAVATLAEAAGFSTLRLGGLAMARHLEPLGFLNIALGYGQGLGTSIAPAWLTAA